MPGHNHVRAIPVLIDGPQRPGGLPVLIRRRLVRVERDVLVRSFERNGELRSTVALGIVAKRLGYGEPGSGAGVGGADIGMAVYMVTSEHVLQ